MSSLIFWNNWPATQKRIFQLLLMLLGASVVLWLFGYFYGARLLIQWETISKITTIPLLLDTWEFLGIPMSITVDQFLITQVFEGSDLEMVTWPAAVLLTVLASSLVVGLSLAVNLNRFWFLTSQVAFIFILVGFKLEQLLLFDRTDKVALILAFALYLPVGYYFHSLGENVRLSIRLLVYGLITALFAGIIHYFSGVEHPFLYLANYGIVIPLILTAVFILFTGHEVIYGFLLGITRNNTPNSKNSFVHFFALSIIYLVNVLLLYLRNTRRIDWDLYYLDAFWVLLAAAIIGLWSLRRRSNLYSNIMPAEPHAVTGYLVLAIISFTTIGYFFTTANDPAIEALEDAVVFSQLSIGFVFLLYILFNFRSVLIANLKVYKVVYDPKKMPFFSMRLGGFVGVLGLFLLSNQYPLDQAITAYYNGIGDLHRIDRQPLLAKEYYKLAGVYAKTNHRSNYAVASMEREKDNLSEALAYYKQSTLKQPTPFAFVNTARIYEEQVMFVKAMFTLKDGVPAFPGEPYISNNLSALYAKTNVLDSAYYYLQGLTENKNISVAAQTNQLSLLTKSGLFVPIDSLTQQFDAEKPPVGSNLTVMANSANQPIDFNRTMPGDSLLNPITFSWWYNYLINQRKVEDSTTLASLSHRAAIPQNYLFSDNLEFAGILAKYYSGFKAQAFKGMANLRYHNDKKAGFYNDILGQWSLQQHQPRLALDYFEQSIRAGYLPGLKHKTLALVALEDFDEAAANWRRYQASTKDSLETIIPQLLDLVTAKEIVPDSLTGLQVLWFLQFRSPELSLREKLTRLDGLSSPEMKAEMITWIWNQALEDQDQYVIEQLTTTQAGIDRKLQRAVVSKDLNNLVGYLEKLDTLDMGLKPWIALGRALEAEQQGNSEAERWYRQLLRDPFFEQGILEAARYFDQVVGNELETYNLLLEALEVNRYSVKLLKAYGITCTKLNLDTYRNSTLETLAQLLSPQQYQDYLAELAVIERQTQNAFISPTPEDQPD